MLGALMIDDDQLLGGRNGRSERSAPIGLGDSTRLPNVHPLDPGAAEVCPGDVGIVPLRSLQVRAVELHEPGAQTRTVRRVHARVVHRLALMLHLGTLVAIGIALTPLLQGSRAADLPDLLDQTHVKLLLRAVRRA